MKMTLLKNKRGFTLGETVTVVAITGILVSVAVPNYMRMRMNVNMELIKQHLKIIGDEMIQVVGTQGQFPDEATWGSGASDEEIAITANLNGIDTKGYTRDEYWTDANRNNYAFRTCPKNGLWGISGDRCFLLDSLGVREIQLWEGWNPDDFIGLPAFDPALAGPPPIFFPNANPSEDEIAFWLLHTAARYNQLMEDPLLGPLMNGRNPAIYVPSNVSMDDGFNMAAVNDVIKNAIFNVSFYQALADRGLQISYFPAGTGNLSHFILAADDTDDNNQDAYGFTYSSSFDASQYQGDGYGFRL